ncbi:DUF2946 family protein [Stutzerimonas zhaodongensis]|uniref:DUF2946 family protein n=1 Tax=Stutzerimonas TaxID=2901164 RepID=UPI0038904C31
MLMIHVGPLYSALQAKPSAGEHSHAHQSAHAVPAGAAHHGTGGAQNPTWLQALDLCGYCELLTLNPPLTLTLELAMPRFRPAFASSRPVELLLPARRHIQRHPCAPPVLPG